MALRFAECRAEDLPALRAFWARAYRPGYLLRENHSLFRWQFGSRSPVNGDAYHIKLATLDGEVVGCLGYIPVKVTLAEGVVRGAWLANWMVDPDRRQLGLGPLLMREVTKQFDVTLNLGPNQDARTVLAKMGWAYVGALTRYLHVLDVEAAASLTPAGRLDWPSPAPWPDHHPGAAVRSVSAFDERATSLWDRLAPSLGWGTRRSADYLNWRYVQHPLWTYRCFEARSDDRLRGFAVYHVEPVRDHGLTVGRLVELVAEPDATSTLLDAVLQDARAQGVALVDFFSSSPRMALALRTNGFFTGEDAPVAQIPMLFQPVDRQRLAIHFMAHPARVSGGASLANWYVTKSDADQDRPN
jgi:GNAT superfamily N-acetyltransferase